MPSTIKEGLTEGTLDTILGLRPEGITRRENGSVVSSQGLKATASQHKTCGEKRTWLPQATQHTYRATKA